MLHILIDLTFYVILTCCLFLKKEKKENLQVDVIRSLFTIEEGQLDV